MSKLQKITPFLWFDGRAEEAARFYVSVFKDGRILGLTPGPGGTVMVADFELFGMRMQALNGGPMYTFTEAVSFVVHCDDQAEVDRYWDALTADGGKESMCGWLKDKFGLSWQIIPREMPALFGGSDAAASGRAMAAMMGMRKLDIGKLKAAYAGE